MLLTRYEPWGLFGPFRNEVNRTRTDNRAARSSIERDWIPAVDIREEADRFVLVADIPGVARDQLDITLEKGVLTITGERAATHREEDGEYRRRERAHGRFARQFTLPDTVDAEHISATVSDGVLEIVIARAKQQQPRKIPVN
jgi:HSP20 family protein